MRILRVASALVLALTPVAVLAEQAAPAPAPTPAPSYKAMNERFIDLFPKILAMEPQEVTQAALFCLNREEEEEKNGAPPEGRVRDNQLCNIYMGYAFAVARLPIIDREPTQ